MRKLIITICISMLLAPAVHAAALKVGYVSVDKILVDAPQVKAINDSMMERFGGKKKQLEDLEAELKTLQDNFKRNELVMTEDKLNEMRNVMSAKYQQYKQQEAVLAQEVKTMQSTELNTLRESMREIIENIAKEEKFDLILSEGVVYGAEELDISDKVLARLKKAFTKK